MSRILGPSGISAPYHEGDPIPRIEIGSDTGAPSRSSTAVRAIPKGPGRPVEYPSPPGAVRKDGPFFVFRQTVPRSTKCLPKRGVKALGDKGLVS